MQRVLRLPIWHESEQLHRGLTAVAAALHAPPRTAANADQVSGGHELTGPPIPEDGRL